MQETWQADGSDPELWIVQPNVDTIGTAGECEGAGLTDLKVQISETQASCQTNNSLQ